MHKYVNYSSYYTFVFKNTRNLLIHGWLPVLLCAFSAATATPEGTLVFAPLFFLLCHMEPQSQLLHDTSFPPVTGPVSGESSASSYVPSLFGGQSHQVDSPPYYKQHHLFFPRALPLLSALFRLVMIILESYSCEQDAWFLASWVLRGKMRLQCPAVIFFLKIMRMENTRTVSSYFIGFSWLTWLE